MDVVLLPAERRPKTNQRANTHFVCGMMVLSLTSPLPHVFKTIRTMVDHFPLIHFKCKYYRGIHLQY